MILDLFECRIPPLWPCLCNEAVVPYKVEGRTKIRYTRISNWTYILKQNKNGDHFRNYVNVRWTCENFQKITVMSIVAMIIAS